MRPLASWMPSAPRRPGEELERVELSPTQFSEVQVLAKSSGAPPDIALTLAWEAELLTDMLGRAGVEAPIDLLDAGLGAARVARPLSSAEADYLRALTHNRWTRVSKELLLPVRLINQLRPIDRRPLPSLHSQTIRWEAEALLAGLTMAEWGLTRALDAR